MVEKHLGKRFEEFIADLFRAESFGIEVEPLGAAKLDSSMPVRTPDLLINSQSGARAIAEVKLYRSNEVSISTLGQVANILEFSRRSFQANKGLLIVGNKVSRLAKSTLSQQFRNIIIYDIDTLAFLVAKHPTLIAEFESIIREALPFSDRREPEPAEVRLDADIAAPAVPSPAAGPERVRTTGHDLCVEIKQIPPGNQNAKKFETKVTDALRYVFEKDLTAWSPQKATDSKISFFDVIARVASEHDFWTAIVNQFRSRYIVFEFKNYTDKIKQGQIYTTEKYLFGTALRSTAIIISRNGADANALAASRGALREAGKLIVNLDVHALCKMLHLRDAGDDHNTVLVEYVDEMLMKLER